MSVARSTARRWGRLAVVLGGFLAAAVVPSDGRALTPGAVILWFDDITNTANGSASVCIAVSNDQNGDGNGNAGKSSGSQDKNGSGTGNAGQGGGNGICF
jgi:hypothetical protein